MTTQIWHSPDQAEAAFYAAFERGDVEAMMAVWSDENDVVCIHPHGPRLTGQREIRDSWLQIMTNSPPMRFRIHELNIIRNDDLSIHFVNENIHVGDADEPNFTILATNIYRRTADGWRIILHHASPTPEALANIENAEQDEDRDEDFTLH